MKTFQLLFSVLVVVLTSGVHGFTNTNHVAGGSKLSSTSSLRMTVLNYNGKKKNFKPGTPLSKALPQIGIKPRYSCKKGDCATCQVFIAGRATRACIGKVPPEPTLKSLQEKGLDVRP